MSEFKSEYDKKGAKYDKEVDKGCTKEHPYYMIHIECRNIKDLYYTICTYSDTAIDYFFKREYEIAFPVATESDVVWYVVGKDSYIIPFKTAVMAGEYIEKLKKMYAIQGISIRCNEIVTEPEDFEDVDDNKNIKNVINFKKAVKNKKKKKGS